MYVFDIFIIALYLIFTLFIGYKAGKNVTDIKKYSIGKCEFSNIQLIATIFATWVGGGFLIGNTTEIYKSGIIALATLGFVGKLVIMSELLVKKFTPFYGAISFGDIMEVFYGKFGKVLSGLLGVVISVGTIAIQLFSISILLINILDITKIDAILLSYGIVIFYSAYGGIKSVVKTDLIQFILIITAVLTLTIFLLIEIGGVNQFIVSVPNWSTSLKLNDHTLNYFYMFVIYLFPAPQPVTVQRILMNKNISQTILSFRLSTIAFILLNISIVVIGLSAIILFPSILPNMVIPTIINEVIPVGFKGLVIIGIISVIMSTADSFINVASISFTHDFLVPVFKISKKKELFYAKTLSIILGTIAIFIALYIDNIINFMFYCHSLWLVSISITFIFGLYNIKISLKNFIFYLGLNFFLVILIQLLLPLKPLGILISVFISILFFISIYILEKNKAGE